MGGPRSPGVLWGPAHQQCALGRRQDYHQDCQFRNVRRGAARRDRTAPRKATVPDRTGGASRPTPRGLARGPLLLNTHIKRCRVTPSCGLSDADLHSQPSEQSQSTAMGRKDPRKVNVRRQRVRIHTHLHCVLSDPGSSRPVTVRKLRGRHVLPRFCSPARQPLWVAGSWQNRVWTMSTPWASDWVVPVPNWAGLLLFSRVPFSPDSLLTRGLGGEVGPGCRAHSDPDEAGSKFHSASDTMAAAPYGDLGPLVMIAPRSLPEIRRGLRVVTVLWQRFGLLPLPLPVHHWRQ